MSKWFRKFPVWALVLQLLVGSPAYAEPRVHESSQLIMFYILKGLEVKWACGGHTSQDTARLLEIRRDFPQDSERMGFDQLLENVPTEGRDDDLLYELFEYEVEIELLNKVCEAAIPLGIAWLDNEILIDPLQDEVDENEPLGSELAHWADFFDLVENM